MNSRLAAAVTAAVVAVPFAATAHAAPPKGFTRTVTFTDATPDPSGNTGSGNENHCNGVLPQETPIAVKIPGPGMLDVTLGGFQGDWTLQLRDASGEVIGGDDVNPPDYETAGVRLRKAQTIQILPCNLAGTPQAQVTYKYTYRK